MDVSTVLVASVAAALGVAVGAAIVHGRAHVRLRQAGEERDTAIAAFRRQERSSQEEREVQDLILSSMGDGVLLLAPDGATVYANGALERLLGMRPAGAQALFPLTFREAVEAAAIDGATGSTLVEVGSPPRWLRVQATPAGDDGSVLAVVRDVTEARRLDAIRRDFVANASHELKTPAASIQAAAETLGQAAADEDAAAVTRFATQLEREAVRLSRIVADLLDLSRLEAGSELDERVHLDALVREEAQRYEDVAARADLRLLIHAPVAAPVLGSGRDLSLLVRNLVDNAIHYTRAGGSVNVTVQAEDGAATLRVHDTGIGIPRRDLSRIFERFYRVDRARSRDTGGTGLGLAIVRHVAENHGGTVRVESELGAGTTVEVTIPCDTASTPGAGRGGAP